MAYRRKNQPIYVVSVYEMTHAGNEDFRVSCAFNNIDRALELGHKEFEYYKQRGYWLDFHGWSDNSNAKYIWQMSRGLPQSEDICTIIMSICPLDEREN